MTGISSRVLAAAMLIAVATCPGTASDPGAHAGAALLRDLNERAVPSFRVMTGPVPLDGQVLFDACEEASGCELWRVPAQNGVATLVRDLVPGPGYSHLPKRDFAVMNGVAYFWSLDRSHGMELWRSDGTAGGTYLVKDIWPGARSWLYGSTDNKWLVVGNELYFRANDGEHGVELWKTDGTAEGTAMVWDITPGRASSSPADYGRFWHMDGALYFMANDGEHGVELWRTAVATGETRLVRDIREGPGWSTPGLGSGIAQLAGRLYFTARTDQGTGLWRTDGSADGTEIVSLICPASVAPCVPSLEIVGDSIYYVGYDSEHGFEPWISDGTGAGTRLLKDLVPGLAGSYPAAAGFIEEGGAVYFSAGNDVWATDGSSGGTQKVANPPLRVLSRSRIFLGETRYFAWTDSAHGTELWRENPDGTAALIKDLVPGPESSNPQDLAVVGDVFLFRAGDALWSSDGTSIGTRRIDAGIAETASSTVLVEGLVHDARLLFAADDGATGPELWTTDGTFVGTRRVTEISLVAGDGAPWGLSPSGFRQFGGDAYFVGFNEEFSKSLWRTDGTLNGTVEVHDGGSPRALTPAVGGLYFEIGARSGFELWRSNGTAGGTGWVATMVPTSYADNASAHILGTIGSSVFYQGRAADDSYALWKSDGTASGTVQLAKFRADESAAVAGQLFLADRYSQDLWVTDGTVEGTRFIMEMRPDPEGSAPTVLASFGGKACFQADDGVHGAELWVSDGTVEGTAMVADIVAGPGGSAPTGLVSDGSSLYFTALDTDGEPGLWRSDGTATGTQRLLRAVIGEVFPVPGTGKVLFAADAHDGTGMELWESDGTVEGTRQVLDIRAGAMPSSPAGFHWLDSAVVFSANDGVHGREPWVLGADATAAPEARSGSGASGSVMLVVLTMAGVLRRRKR